MRRGETRTVQTNDAGIYAIPFLSPGRYHVRASQPGRQALEVYEIDILVGGRTTLDFPLRSVLLNFAQGVYQTGFLPESPSVVHVYASDLDRVYPEPLVVPRGKADGLHSTMSYVADQRQIDELPLFGRDVYTLLVLYPNLTADAATGRGLGISANGQRPSSSSFLLDGIENNDYLLSGPLTAVAPETIQEYRITTNNFTAEYGRTAGYLANAVTRSGGQYWHGLAWFYLKNDVLNAADFGSRRRVPLRELQPGAFAGGPVKKDRVFASISAERLRYRSNGIPAVFRLPRAGFTPQPGTAAEALLSRFSAPDGEVRLEPTSSINRTLVLQRTDIVPAAGRHRLMGRIAAARLGRPDLVWTPYPDFVTPLKQSVTGAVATWMASGTWGSHELRAGFVADDLRFDRPHPEVPILESIDRTFLPGSPALYSFRNRGRSWELVQNVATLRRRHLLKAGVGFLYRTTDGYLTAPRDGYLLFDDLNAFGSDRPAVGFIAVDRARAQQRQRPVYDREYHQWQFYGFAQDSFRIGSRIALDYGIRYEYFGVPSLRGEATGNVVHLGAGDTLYQRLRTATLAPGDREVYDPDHNNVAGRVGIAWGIGREMRTRVRASFGTFYDRPFDNLWQTVRSNDVVVQSFVVRGPVDYRQGISPSTQGFSNFSTDAALSRLTLIQPGLRTPYSNSVFSGIEHDLGRNITVAVHGHTALSRKLITTDSINRPGSSPQVEPGNAQRHLNPNLPRIYYRANQGGSNYHALSAVVRARARRVHLHASYTLSRSFDHQSEPLAGEYLDLNLLQPSAEQQTAVSGFTRQFDSSADWGRSDFDQTHSFVTASIWELPQARSHRLLEWATRDWRISHLLGVRSGRPYSVLVPVEGIPQGGMIYHNRANIIEGVPVETDLARGGGKIVLNRAAFAFPTAATIGNSRRNAFRAPGFYSLDLSVARSFPLTRISESSRLTFRADAFNLLNHANLAAPINTLATGNFGFARYGRRGRATGFPAQLPLNEIPRQIQLLVRFSF
jgi:hypothetical protein